MLLIPKISKNVIAVAIYFDDTKPCHMWDIRGLHFPSLSLLVLVVHTVPTRMSVYQIPPETQNQIRYDIPTAPPFLFSNVSVAWRWLNSSWNRPAAVDLPYYICTLTVHCTVGRDFWRLLCRIIMFAEHICGEQGVTPYWSNRGEGVRILTVAMKISVDQSATNNTTSKFYAGSSI